MINAPKIKTSKTNTPNILIIDGLANLSGAFQSTREIVRNVFAKQNQAFIDTFGLEEMARSNERASSLFCFDFNESVRLAKDGGGYSGAAHILVNEAIAGGFDPEVVLLREVFCRDDQGGFVLTPAGEQALRGHEVVALSTSFILGSDFLRPLLQILRSRGKTIIVGGALINKLPCSVMETLDADYAMSWEAEGRLSILLDEIRSGAPCISTLDAIPGLWWQVDQKLQRSSAPYAPIDFKHQRVLPTREFVRMRGGVHGYESIRGCPFRCEFCDYPFLVGGKKARYKDAQWIFDEWKALYELGVRRIDALDSLFTIPMKRMEELADLLIRSGLAKKIIWRCFARSTELADLSFAERLKEAGCTFVFVGIESGSQVILDNMNKKTKVDDNLKAIENCDKAELPLGAGFVVGFPGETESTFNETLALLRQHSSPVISPFLWYPDSPESPKVPIMQPDRVEKYGIHVEQDPVCVTTTVWGKPVPFLLPITWRHRSMGVEEAVGLLAKLSHETRDGIILGHDAELSPYATLVPPHGKIDEVLGYESAKRFARGLRDLYIRFDAGEQASNLRPRPKAGSNNAA